MGQTWPMEHSLPTSALTYPNYCFPCFLKINSLIYLFSAVLFIYFWPCWVFVARCRFSLVAMSRDYSLVVVHRLLTACGFPCCRAQRLGAWASVAMTHRFSSSARRLYSLDSVVLAQELSCSVACGIFLDQGSIETVSPALAGEFFSTEPPGKSYCFPY